jgi:LPXTG-site transpeptidase (sortase) family protein
MQYLTLKLQQFPNLLKPFLTVLSICGVFLLFYILFTFDYSNLNKPSDNSDKTPTTNIVQSTLTEIEKNELFKNTQKELLNNPYLDSDNDNMPNAWETTNGLDPFSSDDKNSDPDGDGLYNINEYWRGTDPNNSDTDGDSFGDWTEITRGYDPTASGEARPSMNLAISKIETNAPIVWAKSADEKDMQKDLETGVIRFPDTGIPGFVGNTIISGHSSNFVWAKGNYNHIFAKLGQLEIGDTLQITSTQANGKYFSYTYKIVEKKVTTPSDPWVFADTTDKKILTVSTCWPIGTDISRLVLKAEQI